MNKEEEIKAQASAVKVYENLISELKQNGAEVTVDELHAQHESQAEHDINEDDSLIKIDLVKYKDLDKSNVFYDWKGKKDENSDEIYVSLKEAQGLFDISFNYHFWDSNSDGVKPSNEFNWQEYYNHFDDVEEEDGDHLNKYEKTVVICKLIAEHMNAQMEMLAEDIEAQVKNIVDFNFRVWCLIEEYGEGE